MFQIDEEDIKSRACIKVVGVGGGGGNALQTMAQSDLSGVEFIAANTDAQALEIHEGGCQKVQLGVQLTKGLGAGANPEIGRQAAIESCDELAEALKGADMVFVTAGMGGGTGTGAAGVIASIAKRQGALTVGVVTRPFVFEGQRRSRHAETGIQFLKENVDTLIVIPNQRLLKVSTSQVSLLDAFKNVDRILLQAVKGISDLINQRGIINLDFADVKTIMSEKGLAIIGVGQAEGDGRALLAARRAASSPLLEEASFKGALGVMINITGGQDLALAEVNEIAELVTNSVHPDAEIIFGTAYHPDPTTRELSVTVIATGFESQKKQISPSLNSQKEAPSPSALQEEAVASASAEGSPPVVAPEAVGDENVSLSSAGGLVKEGRQVLSGSAPVVSPGGTRLPKDILLEKARLYQQQQNRVQQHTRTSSQLSMDMEPKGGGKTSAPAAVSPPSSREVLPFKKSKSASFIGLFRKPDKRV